jgi:hypothetical protein
MCKVGIIDYSVVAVYCGVQGSRGQKEGEERKQRRKKEGREDGKRRERKNLGRELSNRRLSILVFGQNEIGR